MKKILVLGASYSQLPLLEAAKRLGVESGAVTIPGPYAGISHADHVFYADIRDPEAVLSCVRGFAPDGVTTSCMDLGTRTMGYLCEKLSLPGPGRAGTEGAVDKSLQKVIYEKAGIRTAPFRIVHTESELREAASLIGYPCMVKAVDLTGSRGIHRAECEEEALLYFQEAMRLSGKDYCLVEKFLKGTMFGVTGMISQGRAAFILPLGNILHQGNPPFPAGHYVPFDRAEGREGKIREMVEKTAKALQFDNCAFDMDCMLADGECFVIEATPRCGATGIAGTVGLAYGIDYYEAIVRCALGEDVRELFQKAPGELTPSASHLLAAEAEGRIRAISVPELPPEVVHLSFNVKEGDVVRPMRSGADRIGEIMVQGKDGADARRILEGLLGEISVTVI